MNQIGIFAITLPQGNITNDNWIGTTYVIWNNTGSALTIDPGTTGTCGSTGVDCINDVDSSNGSIPAGEIRELVLVATDASATNEWIMY